MSWQLLCYTWHEKSSQSSTSGVTVKTAEKLLVRFKQVLFCHVDSCTCIITLFSKHSAMLPILEFTGQKCLDVFHKVLNIFSNGEKSAKSGWDHIQVMKQTGHESVLPSFRQLCPIEVHSSDPCLWLEMYSYIYCTGKLAEYYVGYKRSSGVLRMWCQPGTACWV